MKVYLDTVGCRLNQAEIEIYAGQFRTAGHTLVSSPQEADMVVVNTCAVTASASADSRKLIRRMAKVEPDEVVVTGCWSSLNPELALNLPGVSRVVSNLEKDHLVSDVLDLSPDSFDIEPILREPIPGDRARTRFFAKVQDGCDNRCTFCVTTLARGSGRSRKIEDVIRDINMVSGDGGALERAQEVILTGVHLGSWGRDLGNGLHLYNLVERVLVETNVPRLRLSSLEPWDIDPDFFKLWENRRLCRHLHLPLQSGSASTLRRMARKTTPDAFANIIDSARQHVPEMAITTDVITGFPGETEEEFQESLEFIESMRFAGGHVFTYSSRPGTAGSLMSDQVNPRIAKSRSAIVRESFAESQERYQKKFIGQKLTVLWETGEKLEDGNWMLKGLTDNYIKIRAKSETNLWNQFSDVVLDIRNSQGINARIMDWVEEK